MKKRNPPKEYFEYRREVWRLLKLQGLSQRSLPKAVFLRPHFNSGFLQPEGCATLWLEQIPPYD
jgi:hypothetical protein